MLGLFLRYLKPFPIAWIPYDAFHLSVATRIPLRVITQYTKPDFLCQAQWPANGDSLVPLAGLLARDAKDQRAPVGFLRIRGCRRPQS
jgi:hypothetical protein